MATLAEVQKRLEEIRDMGYIPTTRRGPTGIGHTFETYIGLDETNLQIPDIGGRIEIKTARGNSGSLITLFITCCKRFTLAVSSDWSVSYVIYFWFRLVWCLTLFIKVR